MPFLADFGRSKQLVLNHVLDTTAKQLISRWRRVATAKHKFRTHSPEVKSTSSRRHRVKKRQCLSSLLLARGGGRSPKNFPDIPKKFSGHITKFPLTPRTFRENTKIFSGHVKIFPKFLSFARILHCFLPNRKNFGGARAPCAPPARDPPAHTPMVLPIVILLLLLLGKTYTARNYVMHMFQRVL